MRHWCQILVAGWLLGLAACGAPENGEAPQLDVDQQPVTLPAAGGERVVDLRTNVSWVCEISPPIAREWLSVDAMSGGAGRQTIRLTAMPNDSYASREATLYIDAGGVNRSVRITQLPSVGVSVSQSVFEVKQAGGPLKVIVFSNVQPEVKIIGSWIHQTTAKTTASLQPRHFDFLIDENPDYKLRKGKIAFSEPGGTVADTVYIDQDAAIKPLDITPSSLTYSLDNSIEYLNVTTTAPQWDVAVTPNKDWCTAEKEGGTRVRVRVRTNMGKERTAIIRITAGEHVQDVPLTQAAFDPDLYYNDKQVVQLQQATAGNGVDLILMGDGYPVTELARSGGKYERDMRAAADHFFVTYPYNAYRHYFNVYMVTAVSEEAGMSCVSPVERVDTKFETLWQGTSTTIGCNDVTVRNYALAVTTLTGRPMRDMTVIVPINRDVYAGTCLMWTDGFSIAMLPVGSKFDRLVAHEAGGHGFAKLLDEYIYYDEPIPADVKAQIAALKRSGFYINADFSNNIAETTWSGFANHPKYPMVGIFPGAYMYSTGIWRPEQNSCMNNNILYYNAPSRWVQVKRIRELAGGTYTFNDFLREDPVPAYPAEAAKNAAETYVERFIPTRPPVVITSPSDGR